MNKVRELAMAATAVVAWVALAQTARGPVAEAAGGFVRRPGGPTPEMRAKAAEHMYRKFGGTVMMPNREPGILFMDCREGADLKVYDPMLDDIRDEFRVSCYARAGKFEGLAALVEEATKTNKNACVVAIVDVEGYPQMTAMPDNRCAIVNVRPLRADGPIAPVFTMRLRKMAYRAFGVAMGAAWSTQAGGLMQSALTLKELDAIHGRAAAPDSHFPMEEFLAAAGVARGGRTTFRRACEEGWNPAPTNEIQQVILDEAKRGVRITGRGGAAKAR